MVPSTHFREQAAFLRESTGSKDLEKTLAKALKVFKRFNIPHFVCGGFAVQERGYPRFTVDVDIIVPDVEFAMEKLAINGFKRHAGSTMTLTGTTPELHLLPGGVSVHPGPLALPMPTTVSDQPQILALEELLSGKLSTYLGRGIHGVKDWADAVELIKANHPPRDLGVDPLIRGEYQRVWDELHRTRS